jgi:hypothetical protein
LTLPDNFVNEGTLVLRSRLSTRTDRSYPYRLDLYRSREFDSPMGRRPLVVVHGYSAQVYGMQWLMHMLAELLRDEYAVYQYAFETRPVWVRTNSMSLEAASRELRTEIVRVAKRDELKLDRPAFIGHSTGGLVARRAFIDENSLLEPRPVCFYRDSPLGLGVGRSQEHLSTLGSADPRTCARQRFYLAAEQRLVPITPNCCGPVPVDRGNGLRVTRTRNLVEMGTRIRNSVEMERQRRCRERACRTSDGAEARWVFRASRALGPLRIEGGAEAVEAHGIAPEAPAQGGPRPNDRLADHRRQGISGSTLNPDLRSALGEVP